MTYLLFPGRHLLNTAFQATYLQRIVRAPLQELDFLDGVLPDSEEPVDEIIFAITSSNQQHSRYNPIPFYVRALGVDRFARFLRQEAYVQYRIIGIPHHAPTPRFAEILLKEIAEQTEGQLRLTPGNSIVLSSTPDLFNQFRALGYSILPAEYGETDPKPATPFELLKQIVAAGDHWHERPEIREQLSPATCELWCDFPDVPQRMARFWRDPLLHEDGSLTDSRDYATYASGMRDNEIVNVKYDDIKDAIVPGKIVDERCADGALLVRVAQDFPDSDLIGIEKTGELMARCRERQRAGQFGGTFVHFHQRNIMQPIFEAQAIDTTLCNATVHELWSYGAGALTVRDYFRKKYEQTRPGGRIIIRDVVGPEAKEQEIYLRLEHRDGANDNIHADFDDAKAFEQHLRGLSTYARFKRFARDFLAGRRPASADGRDSAFPYRESIVHGDRCAIVALRYAAEFLSKKDYVDNWRREMHEEFAFWSFSEWKAALADAGFRILENPNAPEQGSRLYTNPWIVANRWQGKVELYCKVNGRLEPLAWPPTNLVLVGEKPLQ